MSKAKQRFIEGKGQRFCKHGGIRCHSVSKTRLKRLREEKNDPTITADEAWPELQCHYGARPGYYVCYYHGAGKVGGPVPGVRPMQQAKDISKYLKNDLADKYRTAVSDPEIFNQRQNVALLSARNAELVENIAISGLSDVNRLKQMRNGLKKIEEGDPKEGARLIRQALAGIDDSKSAWEEIRKNTSVIKDLTNAEINRQKEMRLTLTAEQVMAKFEEFSNALIDAVEKNVHDEEILKAVYSHIVGAARGVIGTGGRSLLPEVTDQD